MKWSVGSTAVLLALAAGSSTWAAEPTMPARGFGLRPSIWPAGQGFLNGNHIRPVTTDVVGEEIVEGHAAPGLGSGCANCDSVAPCTDHLWNGYFQRPRRCHLGAHHGIRGCAPCNDDGNCGLFGGGHIRAKHGACDECGGHAAFCRRCGGCGIGKGGFGKFWASAFGNDCGCSDGPADCGCNGNLDVSHDNTTTVLPGSVAPQPTIVPTPIPESRTLPAPEVEVEKAPKAPKPTPEDESSARRLLPSFRGFGSFGL